MWEISLNEQAITFLLSLILGAVYCLVFDFTRGMRIFGINSRIAVFFTDIIYFLLVAFVNFCFFLTRESGQIRGYVFVGEIIGFFLFRLTLSKIIMIIISFLHRVYTRIKTAINRAKAKVFLKIKEKTSNFAKKVKKPIKKG